MKRVFNFLFILSLTSNLFAQNSKVVQACYPDRSRDMIVKVYNYPQLISSSYCPDFGNSYMCLKDNTNMIKLKIIRDCKVNDFVIANDTVFFCGQSTSGKGVIGFFDINDYFYFNSGNYYIQESFSMMNGYYAANLTKLVTYLDHHNSRHVFAIGYTSHDFYTTDIFGCIVDMMDAMGGYTNYIAAYAYKKDSSQFQDVAISGSYVVTTGFEDNIWHLNSRLFFKNSPFALSGVQNTPAEFYGAFDWVRAGAHVSSSSNGFFSLSAISQKKKGQAYVYTRFFLAKISLNSIVNQLPNAVNISRQLSFPKFQPNKIHEFLYNHTNDCYSILCNTTNNSMLPFYSYNRNIFAEIKPAIDSHYFAFSDYDDDLGSCESNNLCSFDIFNNGNYAYCGDCCSQYPWCKYYQYETSGHQSLCSPEKECVFYDVPVQQYFITSELTNNSGSCDIQFKKSFWWDQRTFTDDCSH